MRANSRAIGHRVAQAEEPKDPLGFEPGNPEVTIMIEERVHP